MTNKPNKLREPGIALKTKVHNAFNSILEAWRVNLLGANGDPIDEDNSLPTQVIDLIKITRTDVINSILTYKGYTKTTGALGSDAVWKITRIYKIGTQTIEESVNGGTFDQIWDDRVSLFPILPLTNTYSLNFDGVNEYIDFGDNYNVSPAVAHSWSFWLKPQNFAAQRCIFSKTTNDANVFGVGVYITTSGTILIQMRASGQLRSHVFSTILSSGVWQHLVLTYDGGNNMNGWKVYVNEVLDGSTPSSGAVTNSLDTTEPLYFGRRGSSFYYSGNMNQVTRWSKELSSTEVTTLYNSGSPNDPTTLVFSGDLQSWWPLAEKTDYPNAYDIQNSIDGTLMFMETNDFVLDVP